MTEYGDNPALITVHTFYSQIVNGLMYSNIFMN